jgi:hypothetical protein
MISLAVYVLAGVIGLVAVAVAIAILYQSKQNLRVSFYPRRRLGGLTILIAGLMLAAGSGEGLKGTLERMSARDDARGAVQSILDKPMASLILHVFGPDPFADESSSSVLRLHAVSKKGFDFVSGIPRKEMVSADPPPEGYGEYHIAWQSVVDSATTAEGKAAASQFLRVDAWQKVDRLDIALVLPSANAASLPETLEIVPNEEPLVNLFVGSPMSPPAKQVREPRVTSYEDELTLPDRIDGWLEPYMPPPFKLGPARAIYLTAAFAILVVGVVLTFLKPRPLPGDAVPTTPLPPPSEA